MQDLTQLGGNGLTSGSNLNLGIDSGMIASILTIATTVSIVLGIAIVVYMIINIAHRWKSEKAMVEMAKDIRAIKDLLEKKNQDETPKPRVQLADAATEQKQTSEAEA